MEDLIQWAMTKEHKQIILNKDPILSEKINKLLEGLLEDTKSIEDDIERARIVAEYIERIKLL